MPEQKQVAARHHTAEESREHGGADLRNPELDADVGGILDEIDCCLAEAEDERKAAQQRAARQEYEAIQAAHKDECLGRVLRRGQAGNCPHIRQMRVWDARYAHLFGWCCGVPEFNGG